eukprot:4654083-Pleurochrysis_carterae.AAC.1
MVEEKQLRIFPPTEAPIQIAKDVDIDVRFSGDFQIIKAINNMSPYTSAIWCMCQGAGLRQFCQGPLSSWEEVCARWADVDFDACCEIKTLTRVCHLNGYSPEVLRGLPFKPFDCGCTCEREHRWATEQEWMRWVSKVESMGHS